MLILTCHIVLLLTIYILVLHTICLSLYTLYLYKSCQILERVYSVFKQMMVMSFDCSNFNINALQSTSALGSGFS